MLDGGVDRVQRAARGAAAAVAAAAGRAVDPRARLGDDVEILRRDVHVAGRAVRAAERGDELAVAPEEALARLAGRQLRHREHGLAAAARHPGGRHLPRHRPRQAHRVGEAVGRSGVDAQARAAAGRAEHGGVDADEHPGAALGVVADDGVLAVPAREEALEVHAVDAYRSASRLHSAAGMAGERTKLVVAQRERLGSAESRRLRKEGLVPGVLYGSGEPVAISVEERELRRALTGAAGLHSILDVEIDGKGETHASILKEYQVDPVRGGVTHVDLQEVRLDQTDQRLGLRPLSRWRRRAGRAARAACSRSRCAR